MPYSLTFVCLADSRKHSEHCIAGRQFVNNRFESYVRPVSISESEAISRSDFQFKDGGIPRKRDVLQVQMMEPRPNGHQQENHVFDNKFYWQRTGRLSWDDIQGAVEQLPGAIWGTDCSSKHNRINDRITKDDLAAQNRSLVLVRPENLRISVAIEGAAFGNPRRRVRACFHYNGFPYMLVVTDYETEAEYLARQDGEYVMNEALICVSLTGLHTDGYAYKLVAGVITPGV